MPFCKTHQHAFIKLCTECQIELMEESIVEGYGQDLVQIPMSKDLIAQWIHKIKNPLEFSHLAYATVPVYKRKHRHPEEIDVGMFTVSIPTHGVRV
jgi:hypothetical protein